MPSDVYAASCNPPRRAKRVRPDDSPPYPHPVRESPSPSTDNPDDVPQPSPPKRRGRKPGTLSRAAREAQRKINHSLIEKARRTKINDALATLRTLVPPHYKRAFPDDHHQDESDDDQDPTSTGINRPKQQKSKGSGEKEFKLEILVRTVAYLQDLTERAESLERDGCPHCSKSISSLRDGGPARPTDEPATAPPPSAAPKSTSRLPSISTWLPTLTPSQSPSCDLTVPSPSSLGARPSAIGANIPPSHQLPTPPTSAAFASSSTSTVVGVLPALTLPSPRTLLPAGLHGLLHPTPGTLGTNANLGIAHGGKKTNNGSPAASPVYTPEDETAASLLLRMSTSSSTTSPILPTSPQSGMNRLRSSSSASLTSMWLNPAMMDAGAGVSVGYGGGGGGVSSRSDAESGPSARSALTPSRLLGLATRRSEVSDTFYTFGGTSPTHQSHSR